MMRFALLTMTLALASYPVQYRLPMQTRFTLEARLYHELSSPCNKRCTVYTRRKIRRTYHKLLREPLTMKLCSQHQGVRPQKH